MVSTADGGQAGTRDNISPTKMFFWVVLIQVKLKYFYLHNPESHLKVETDNFLL